MGPVVRPMMKKNTRRLLKKLESTEEVEYSCEEAYALLDVYAEMTLRGEDPTVLMPLVKHHLDTCDNCREEFEALLNALANISN